jgi:esterase/lipase
LKQKCKDFAEKHKQNINFVMHTVEITQGQDENMIIDTALNKLYEELIKKPEESPLTYT